MLDIFESASNFLNQLYRDRQGNIWLATLNDGVYVANLHKPIISSNPLVELKSKFGYVDVNAFIQQNDKIWLGLRNFGVYVVDKNSNRNIKPLLPQDHKIMKSVIKCFSKDRKSEYIWIGGNGVLAKINTLNNTVVELPVKFINFIGKGNVNVSAIYSDSDNNKWIATRRGIIKLKDNGVYELVNSAFNNVQIITEDISGNIWAGSPSKGILKILQTSKGKYNFEIFNIKNGKINSDEIKVGSKNSFFSIFDLKKT